MLNTHNVKVGDKVREIATGKVYTVSQIAPAGYWGAAVGAGPRVTVSLGPGRYSFAIQHGALRDPAAFELADDDN